MTAPEQVHLPQLFTTPAAKQRVAQIVAWPGMRFLMRLGIALFIPRRRLGVALVVFNPAGQVLLLRHVFHSHFPWGLPGGWLSGQESPADCAVRELREETGLTGLLGPVVHVDLTRPFLDINIAYLVDSWVGEIRPNREIIEAGWFDPDNLPAPLLRFQYEAITRAQHMAACGANLP